MPGTGNYRPNSFFIVLKWLINKNATYKNST